MVVSALRTAIAVTSSRLLRQPTRPRRRREPAVNQMRCHLVYDRASKLGDGQQETVMPHETPQPPLDEICERAEIGTVRAPEFRLFAAMIRMNRPEERRA